ncbi:MAG TPA: NADH-quinone oxidoreductase subunit J [Bacteroidales bacterium]|jgi:NADH-quinone oxidoreductase subunit J|nr:NADH-quinone oxidoreductase subunit J [Bacteroidales bacterium]
MAANQIMFILFSLMIIVFSILTVTSRKILRAAVYLLFVLVSTSGLYFMLNYHFLAAVQLTLYAGGIVVLIIFSILLTSHISQKFEPVGIMKSAFSALAAIAGAILAIVTILDYSFQATTEAALATNMKLIGKSLLSVDHDGYVLPFEVISILLLAAMIGAIAIAKKGGPKQEQTSLNQ